MLHILSWHKMESHFFSILQPSICLGTLKSRCQTESNVQILLGEITCVKANGKIAKNYRMSHQIAMQVWTQSSGKREKMLSKCVIVGYVVHIQQNCGRIFESLSGNTGGMSLLGMGLTWYLNPTGSLTRSSTLETCPWCKYSDRFHSIAVKAFH